LRAKREKREKRVEILHSAEAVGVDTAVEVMAVTAGAALLGVVETDGEVGVVHVPEFQHPRLSLRLLDRPAQFQCLAGLQILAACVVRYLCSQCNREMCGFVRMVSVDPSRDRK